MMVFYFTGVEPWSFYFINGFLNLNVVFILALLAFPLIESEVTNSRHLCTSFCLDVNISGFFITPTPPNPLIIFKHKALWNLKCQPVVCC